MPDISLVSLLLTAAGLGLAHTVLGPDHYVPFIAISRARQWSLRRTAIITTVCGIAHVGSSVLIGIIGLKLSMRLSRLEALEAFRGDIAAWLIIAFGLLYLIYGLKKVVSSENKTRLREQLKDNQVSGASKKSYKQLTPWILFIVFLFGPCEPLIPLLMFPAAGISTFGIVSVAAVFGVVTIATMLVMVLAPAYGIQKLRFPLFRKYNHAIAGILILLCGVGIRFLGL